MNKIAIYVIFTFLLIGSITLLLPTTVDAKARYGSHRVGGYNSHGKGSHYVGGYLR